MTGLIALLWALGFVLLRRVPACPPLLRGGPYPSLSIIIPARNEAGNLASLLPSIHAQRAGPGEVLVADDASTDDTVAIARRHGARVVRIPPLPDGWRGKTWACMQAAGCASGEVLLFLDADTVLEPDALERMWAAYLTGDCRALSLGPYHDVRRPYEQLSAIFNVVMYMGMGSFSGFGSPDRPHGLFGPCLLIDGEVYRRYGGHASVRGEILEHLALGRRLRQAGVRMRCLGGRGVLRIRMYPDGLSSLIEGWTKAFAAGAAKTDPLILAGIVAWMTGGMLAFILTALAPAWPWVSPVHVVGYAAYSLSLFGMVRPIGRFSFWSCLLYPVLLMAFFAIFFRSAYLRKTGQGVTWKGRTIGASTADRL